MPTRVVRDGLLESEAVLSLPPEGRWLYVSILLSADDYGLFEATTFKLAKRGDVKAEHVPALLQAMVDADLVRLYQPPGHALRRFGVVTKFSQRNRGYKPKYPLPPRALVLDEEALINKINGLAPEKTDRGQPTAVHGRPEAEAEAEAEEPNGSSKTFAAPSVLVDSAVAEPPRKRAPACPTDEIVQLWHKHCAPPLPSVGVLNDARRTALSTRWREVCADTGFDRQQGLEWFSALFANRVAGSDFLMGRSKSWRCSWDWLMRPTNFAKVVDGNYANSGRPSS